ncbi:dTDP-4-dehydrorhamnose reductase [Sphingomonas prati]|uniref:dTDP-4-dehydrorhamnose reductase n=1 Tax=Sphingomonas prati TaxID=1843237 RepID=A0A7W9BUD6_9SPHN|nr:dTDP-4-dehydrorhamnose reductase [Sphingomonas prati]MBB5729833.1 dTDP-4-dehydrorhamnose reductase [Sphingomonas prati]
MSAMPGAVRILVTGGAGQLGLALAAAKWSPQVTLLCPTRAELDLTDAAGIAAWFDREKPDAVVNSAAYTAVDKAEQDIAVAWAANATGPALLAAASAEAGIPIVQVSTDYVFDGTVEGAYAETDPVAPLGVYGSSKLAGEIAVRTGNPRSVILRTAWVVSATRVNFVKTMLRLGETMPELRVVSDQYGCPTSATDIASTIVTIVEAMVADAAAPTGTYHFVNAGSASWCDLAREVFTVATGITGRPGPLVHAITTADYPTPARRPANSRLSTARLTRDYGIEPQPWRPAIRAIVQDLVTAQPAAMETNR